MSNTYAITDLHGDYDIWLKIKQFLNPDDKIYFLGDAIDRGYNGYKLLIELLSDERVTFIIGNHEDMMIQALQEEQTFGIGDVWHDRWMYNGGYTTYIDWQNNGADYSIIPAFNTLMKKFDVYKNTEGKEIYLSHSGFIPKSINDSYQFLDLWNRKILFEGDSLNRTIVCGHTPVQTICKDILYPIKLHSIIDIDLGTFHSQRACVLNLDTFEYYIFNKKGMLYSDKEIFNG